MKLATDQTLLLVQFGFRRPWETAVVSCKHEPFKTLENILKTKISIKLKQYITSKVEKTRKQPFVRGRLALVRRSVYASASA